MSIEDEYVELDLVKVTDASGKVTMFAVDESTFENMDNTAAALTFCSQEVQFSCELSGKVLVRKEAVCPHQPEPATPVTCFVTLPQPINTIDLGDVFLCDHANEVPVNCKCKENCYCKTHGSCRK